MDVKPHPFSTSVPEEDGWLASCIFHSIHGKEPVWHWTGGWKNTGTDPDMVVIPVLTGN
jgi:hypothetical protein